MLGLAELGGLVAVNSTSLALVSAATALVGIWIWSQQKPRKNFPPGPKGWPLIGNILDFKSDTAHHVILTDYAKKYGNIYSIRIGQRWTVVLNGATVIKEALLKNGVEFANRPSSYSVDLFSEGGKDILFGQFTPTWKLHRKLAHSAFSIIDSCGPFTDICRTFVECGNKIIRSWRTLATGNNERFEKLVYSIVPGLTKHLESKGSEPFNPKSTLASAVYNILATMCFGRQLEFDGPEVRFWMRMSKYSMELIGDGFAADYIPIFKYVPTPATKKFKNLLDEYFSALNRELEEHRASYDGGEPKDLIEMLLQARQKMENGGSEDMKKITDTHIRQTLHDIFDAGTDTSIFTLQWSVGLLVQHPEVQAKVAAEVDKVVGRDRLPCLNDRDNLPYTTAALYEVMRYSSIVPLSIPHATSKEVQIGGYTIPEGTWVFFNLYSMHYDEKLWNEPHQFKPEHFLDETGEVRLHPAGFLPFSTGRRVCLGESVAKAELFLLFSWLFQHFEFAKAPGLAEKDYSESETVALSNIVKENDVVVKKRF